MLAPEKFKHATELYIYYSTMRHPISWVFQGILYINVYISFQLSVTIIEVFLQRT